jgi:hypothetical protein
MGKLMQPKLNTKATRAPVAAAAKDLRARC